MEFPKMLRSCWLEINLDNIKHNFYEIKKHVKDNVKVMAVVKANAYGHGIVQCSKVLEQVNADILGVGSLDDAVKLRENGINLPILVFASNLITDTADVYVQNNLIPTILSSEQAEAISNIPGDTPHPVFLKIETGRGRLGINAEEMLGVFKKIRDMPNLSIEGVYSHMANVNWPDISNEYSLWQFERFEKFIGQLASEKIEVPFLQLANSAGLIAYPNLQLSGVAPGSSIWGYSSLTPRPGHPHFKNVLTSWKSRLIQVKEVIGGKFGESFSAVKLETPKRIGVFAGGLSDGIDHKHASGGSVIVRGKKVPLASSIAIEHSIVDLTGCPEAQAGDEVVILGKQGMEEITLDDLCRLWDRPPLQFLTSLSLGLQRVYFKENKVFSSCANGELQYL